MRPLDAYAATLTPRKRPTAVRVGDAILRRIQHAGVRCVSVPQRDLVLDTGIHNRNTIAEVLRGLDGRLGTLHTVFDAARPADHPGRGGPAR